MLSNRVSTWMNEVRILDGGFGSECQRRTKLKIDGHKAWSCRLLKEDPNLVCEIHKCFLRAGSDVISTNTYQASPETLMKSLKVSHAEAIELMIHGVRLARRAIDAIQSEEASLSVRFEQPFKRKLPILLAGSLGPYGACMADGSEYTGSYMNDINFADLVEFHFTRAKILVEAGVDFLAWETIPAVAEVIAICEVMRRLPTSLGWVSVASVNGKTTVGGDSLRQVALEVDGCDQIFGVGVNCNIAHDMIGQALKNLSSIYDPCESSNDDNYHSLACKSEGHPNYCNQKNRKLLLVYANSGELWVQSSTTSRGRGKWIVASEMGSNNWVSNMTRWVQRRQETKADSPQDQAVEKHTPLAQWAGGCCRVGPEQIRKLAEYMKPDEFNCSTQTVLSHTDTRNPKWKRNNLHNNNTHQKKCTKKLRQN